MRKLSFTAVAVLSLTLLVSYQSNQQAKISSGDSGTTTTVAAMNGTDNDNDGFDSTVDCDDNDPQVTVGPLWFADTDNDGFGDPNFSMNACTQPQGYANNDLDCDDTNFNVKPTGIEVCNGIDDDCDGSIDEFANDALTWYRDADNDGFGDLTNILVSCTQPEGYVSDFNDCNDSEPGLNPNTIWYADIDQDGYGNPNNSLTACDLSNAGYVLNDLDCNDNVGAINPGALDVCDGFDNDCDGQVDNDSSLWPTWYADTDNDGFGDANAPTNACIQPVGYVSNDLDCDDTDFDVKPTGTEVCNGIDDDCDGQIDEFATDALTWYRDADGDGFGDLNDIEVSCTQPQGYVSDDSDCDDTDASINPNTVWYADVDQDGFGNGNNSLTGCDLSNAGYVLNAGDCNDNAGTINPNAAEICDGFDNDCDGSIDEDFDLDGDGVTTCAGDCDDSDASVYPGAPEVCDGIDNDCDGVVDTPDCNDQDGDGVPDSSDNCPTTPNAGQADGDCDGVGDVCDQWDGCDDSLDSDGDGTPDCVDLDEMANWECHPNGKKVYICHNGNTLCVNKNSINAHLSHGDFIGDCSQAWCGGSRVVSDDSKPANTHDLELEAHEHTEAAHDHSEEAHDHTFETEIKIEKGFDYEIFPNPATSEINIDLRQMIDKEVNIQIFNQLGQMVMFIPNQQIEQPSLNVVLPSQQIPNGVYALAVISNGEIKTKQFVVRR